MTPFISDIDHLCEVLGIPFSAEQRAAITAPLDVPQAIVAGAGSGKTAVMAARVVWMVGHLGLEPASILGITFTNKAAAELAWRVRTSVQHAAERAGIHDVFEHGEPTVSTYHAFAGALITEHGLRLGVDPELRVQADASKYQLIARVIGHHTGSLAHVSVHVPTLITQIEALDGELSEHLVAPARVREWDSDFIARVRAEPVVRGGLTAKTQADLIEVASRRIELSHLVEEYRAAKIDAAVMDFSDQMAWGAQLAELPEVGAALRERYAAVLLDEYQDTSVAQRDLLQRLFSGVDAAHGRGHSVTAVGDPAQGIYGWRGAAAGNLLEFLDDFPRADGGRGTQHSLAVSRRCGHDVIAVANEVAAPFYATTSAVTPLQAAPENAVGTISAALHATVDDEITNLVTRIRALHGAPREGGGGVFSWKDMAVLVRVGRENGAIVEALRSAEVPVEIVGLMGLLDLPEVRDVMAVLQLLDDVTANPAMLRLLTGPRWAIGPRDLALLGRRAQHLSRGDRPADGSPADPEEILRRALDAATEGTDLTEVLSLAEAVENPGTLAYSPQAQQRFGEISTMLRGLRRHLSEPLPDLARRVVAALDLEVELRVAGLGTDNLASFLGTIADYAQNDRFASLSGLLAYLAAESRFNDGMEVSTPSEADSVKLLTAHKSKGLEYGAVFVPFVAGGVFPTGTPRERWLGSAKVLPAELRGDRGSLPELEGWSTKEISAYKAELTADALMEERRLAYVAFTRAEERLHVSGHRWGRTQKKPRGVSDFMQVVADWLGPDRAPAPWAPEPAADEPNPHLEVESVPWPGAEPVIARRREVADRVAAAIASPPEPGPEPQGEIADRLARVRADLEPLLAEDREGAVGEITVEIPDALSATQALRMAQEPESFARDLVRPFPRRPTPAARFGTRFHAWVEEHFSMRSPLFDEDDVPGRGDPDIASDADLDLLKARFSSGRYGAAEPLSIEESFSIRLGGRVVIGRIDAVFSTGTGVEVVDWKTNQRRDADPLQLAIYRLAYAEKHGLDPATVSAAFHYVRDDTWVGLDDPPDRAELEKLLGLA